MVSAAIRANPAATRPRGRDALSSSLDGALATAALRWTLNQAAREFGWHREALAKRQRALAIEPGEDGCFTTLNIAAMVFGDKEAETIRKLSAEATGQETGPVRTLPRPVQRTRID